MIRPMRDRETPLLTDFLYEAIYQKEGESPLDRTVLQEPVLWQYIDGFGKKKGDWAFVAEVEGLIVGAIWVRWIRGFGFVDDALPELAMSIYPAFRKRGFGTALLSAMIDDLEKKGVKGGLPLGAKIKPGPSTLRAGRVRPL